MEAYTTPANDQDVANHVEEPICEFWWPDGGGLYWSVKAMASVGPCQRPAGGRGRGVHGG